MGWGELGGDMLRRLPELATYVEVPRTMGQVRAWAVLRSIPAAGAIRMVDALVREGKARRALQMDGQGHASGIVMVGRTGEWPAPLRFPEEIGKVATKALGLIVERPRSLLELSDRLRVSQSGLPERLERLTSLGMLTVASLPDGNVYRVGTGWDEVVRSGLRKLARTG